MTVGELIDKLKNYNRDTIVVDDEGYTPTGVREEEIVDIFNMKERCVVIELLNDKIDRFMSCEWCSNETD